MVPRGQREAVLAWLVFVSLIAVSGEIPPVWAGDARHSGSVHSFAPSEGVLVIDTVGTDGAEETVWVDVRAADIVRLSRHPRRPWEWRERPTSVHWLTVGTRVTVVGREGRSGILRAVRIEVPELDVLQ